MRRQTVRRLFAVCLVLLPVQYALVGLVGQYAGSEPWPALVLPAFQAAETDTAGAVYATKPVLRVTFADGTRSNVPVKALLRELPASHHVALLSEQCRPAALSGSTATERCRRPEVRRWLRARLAAEYPGRRPHRMSVVWQQLRYVPKAGTLHTTRLDSLQIDLGTPLGGPSDA